MSKLSKALESLNRAEQKKLSAFLGSTFFNQRLDVLKLYEWWLAHGHLDDKSDLYEHLYPGQPFDPQRLRLAFSYLQQLVNQYLALAHWQATPGAVEHAQMQAFHRRGLERAFQEALTDNKKMLEKQSLRGTDYYQQKSLLYWEEARFESTRNPTEVAYLASLADNADIIWVMQKLRLFCLHQMQCIMYQVTPVLGLKQEVETVINQGHLLEIPAVRIWYYCLKMLENNEETEWFSQFKTVFLSQSQLFSTDEIRDLYLFAINYCIRRVNEGHKAFFHDIMGFYKDGLLKGYLLENGILSKATYHNIVAAALQTREFEWVEQFIGQYRNHLERSYRHSSYSFNMARLEFTRKNYDAALQLLQHSNYYDPLLALAAKTMSLKIYYELNETDLLHAHLEALKNYIRRKVTLGYHRTNYLNLVKYTRRLLFVSPFDQKSISTLKNDIEQESVLTEKPWLLEQIKQLKS